MAFGAAVLLGWTLLGGLDALNQAAAGRAGRRAWRSSSRCWPASPLIGGLLDLPFSLYSTFVVEQRFGFNKMTWKLWLADLAKGLVLAAADRRCRSPR